MAGATATRGPVSAAAARQRPSAETVSVETAMFGPCCSCAPSELYVGCLVRVSDLRIALKRLEHRLRRRQVEAVCAHPWLARPWCAISLGGDGTIRPRGAVTRPGLTTGVAQAVLTARLRRP